MAKGTNQKLKLLYLMQILQERTDENHSISMQEILSALEEYGITAERKSIYSDIESLNLYGLDIIGEKNGKGYNYYMGQRQFQLAELKLLVDSVQSAKFITAKKSNELIKKIEGLASKHEASQLQRQVYVAERVKTMNENIYYNVDDIHKAIGSNVKITFQYFQWDVHKNMVLRHDGQRYEVSPWALTMDDENYYMVAYDGKEDKIKHFRVDKMLSIELTAEKRQGKERFKQFDMAVYSKKMFGMFDGKEQMVRIQCENYLAGVIIDRFGKDVMMVPVDEEHFVVNVKVAVSQQFMGWVISLGEGAKIIGPQEVVEDMQKEVERLVRQYQ